LVAVVRDAGYLTVGFGAVAVEQAQARRRQVATNVTERRANSKSRLEALRGTIEARIIRLDERAEAIEARVETVVDRIESALPEQAGHFVSQARDVTRVARKQVRGLIRTAA
jgi:Holliday junction resolvasome RuvABC endonuclease subunit